MTYAQATRNSTETSTITASNTQEHALIRPVQETFARIEAILSKQAEEVNTLTNLLATVLNKQVK
jgi:hypothetical protein